ncbi:hypothetical protein BST13_20820 [Mycobacterium aquaticum]|uniref:AMP-binding enzyme C-terminal domain-containing protein n=1 Tax=Mycobacterium aquaticum TaxID=1927124 RepID=A0A1X0ASM6_9MYCO|nr:hypothetical protein BST13_20820 [Mycobacterium aquaticum]
MGEWTIGEVLDTIADAAPDRVMTICGERRTTFAQGEKVFVEEVEEILRAVPEVVDALVVGRPSQRWGQEVVAIVALRSALGADVLQEHCAARLARFKIPKDVVFVEVVRRLGNGKADYRWAQNVAMAAGQTKRECV